MKNILYYFAALIILVNSSCEKVIDVDLDDTTPQTVIEAELTEGNQFFEVKVSKTGSYFEDTPPIAIENATITLTYNNSSISIPHIDGTQYGAQINAQANTTYTLTVETDEKTYKASSYLPEPVEIIDVYSEFQESTAFFDEGYFVYFRYQDPAGQDNYYRLIHSLNGMEQKGADDIQIHDDNRNDGGTPRWPIFQKIFDEGDSLQLELRHFDEAAHDYFQSLTDIVDGGGGPRGGSAAPGNPNTNWNNEALGYFIAYSSDSVNFLVP